MNVKNVRCVAGAAFGTRLVVGDMLLPAHVFGGRGSMRLQDLSRQVHHFLPFSKALENERREVVENERRESFSFLANYSIWDDQGSSFQLLESGLGDVVGVVGVLHGCRCGTVMSDILQAHPLGVGGGLSW